MKRSVWFTIFMAVWEAYQLFEKKKVVYKCDPDVQSEGNLNCFGFKSSVANSSKQFLQHCFFFFFADIFIFLSVLLTRNLFNHDGCASLFQKLIGFYICITQKCTVCDILTQYAARWFRSDILEGSTSQLCPSVVLAYLPAAPNKDLVKDLGVRGRWWGSW